MKTFNKYLPLYFIFVIMIFSLLNNYNARLISDLYAGNFYKQLIFYIIGFITIFAFQKIRLSKIYKYHYIYYFITLILLILVLICGKEVNGAKAWFDLKFFSFQPSELMKFTLALTLTKLTTDFNNSTKKNELKFLIKITLLTLIPSFLVFIEPDTGAIIFFLLIFLTAFFCAKISKIYYIIFFISSILVSSFFIYIYFFNQDLLINLIGTSFFYRVQRLISISDNYQLNNALTLMGSSSTLGSGLNTYSLYIPEAPTDFMFAYNFGNFGLIGALIVIISYLLLCLSILFQIKKSKNNLFKKMFASVLFFGIFYNIMMNIGLMPIMGIALPFLSYGGSSLFIYFLFLSVYFKAT